MFSRSSALIGNIFLCLFTVIFYLVIVEFTFRLFHPLPAFPIVPDTTLGWETPTPIVPLHNTNSSFTVYFVGDSMTEGTSWPQQTQENLRKEGLRVDGYNLGVAGYGTTQEFLKLQRYFPSHQPNLVILQVFPWNDLRDNMRYPAIFYSPERIAKPYFLHMEDGIWKIRRPFFSTFFLSPFHSSFLAHKILPLFLREGEALLHAHDADWFSLYNVTLPINYTDHRMWVPFYERNAQESLFVRNAYVTMEHILTEMQQYLQERGAHLMVIGLDNAFTVDRDVLDEYASILSHSEVSLPLTRIGEICKKHRISFINALPALQKESRRLGKKIYNGPKGNLSGHLEPEGYDILARLAAEAIHTYLPEP